MVSQSTLVDRVKISVNSSGTGSFELGDPVPAFRGVEALIDGATYSYAVEEGSNFEIGTGFYTSANRSLTRMVRNSSNGGAAVAFRAGVQIAFTALAEDLVATGGTFPIVDSLGPNTGVAPSQRAATDGIEALKNYFQSPNGGGTAGFSPLASYPDETLGNAAQKIEPSIWQRTLFAEAALRFPGFLDALAVTGGTHIYPQGFNFDDDGNIYLNSTANIEPTVGVIVMYDRDFVFQRYFFRSTDKGESMVVQGSPTAGTLKFFFVVDQNLIEYAPGTLPAAGSTLTSPTTRISGGLGSIFTYNDGYWLMLQQTSDLGVATSRTAFLMYNDAFELVGRFFVAKNITGWQTSSDALYPYVPKMQGIAYKDAKIYISVGGSYIPASDPVAPRAADYGLAELSPDGSLLQYGVLDGASLLARIANLGYTIDRIENEGVAVAPDGSIYTLLVTQRPVSAGSNEHGLILVKEMDVFGESWEDIKTPYSPVDLGRYSGRIWPRAPNNEMINPYSLDLIETMDQLLDFMVNAQTPDVSYFSAVHNLTPVAGFTPTGNQRIDIFNLNNQTFHCRSIGTGTYTQQWFRIAPVGGVWTANPLADAMNTCWLVDGVSAPTARAGYAAIFVDTSDGDLKVRFDDGTTKTIVTDS